MSEEPPDGSLSDDELDALDAEIARDMAIIRQLEEQLQVKLRRYRAELAFRRRQPGTVHEFRPRPGGEPGE